MPNDDNITREIEEGLARANRMLRQQQRRRWMYAFLGLFALVCAFSLGSSSVKPASVTKSDYGVFFSSNRSGKYEIYYHGINGTTTQITQTSAGESWGAAPGPAGILYFVSNRDGKPEIYLMLDGKEARLTNSPGNSGSWDPRPVDGGNFYFVSDRSGKNEIYYHTQAGSTIQVTHTSGSGESQISVP